LSYPKFGVDQDVAAIIYTAAKRKNKLNSSSASKISKLMS